MCALLYALYGRYRIQFLLLNQNNQKEINGHVVGSAFDQWSVIKADSYECDSQFEAAHKVHQKTIFFRVYQKWMIFFVFLSFRGIVNNALMKREREKIVYLN